MAKATSKRRAFLLVAALVAGCTPIPTLEFFSDGVDGSPGTDATLPLVNAGAGDDADDAAPPVDNPLDDGGATGDASIKCGAALVTSCALCAGSPLHCAKGGRNECVADCTACAASWLPCFHCPSPDAAPRGSCLPVGPTGQVACTATNLCPCTTPADCPVSSGAAQTCDVVASTKTKRCETCGAPATAETGCENASGSTGTCHVMDASPPVCE